MKKSTKIFDGKRYGLHAQYGNHRDALRYAKRIRKKGKFFVRVTGDGNIWIRKR